VPYHRKTLAAPAPPKVWLAPPAMPASHGFTASTFAVVRLGDLQEIAHLKTDLTAVYQPDSTGSLFLRYQAQAERHYCRAVEEFNRLKALRAELPNEPILEVQPEESETTCAPPDKPVSTPQPNPEPVAAQPVRLPRWRSAMRCPISPRHREPVVPTRCFGANAVSDYPAA
jgi:hypothetical protein